MDNSVIDTLIQARLVAILRGDYRGRWQAFAEALLAGGISILEVTFNSAGALDGIAEIKRLYGHQIVIGAGTVLTPDQVKDAHNVGVQFIVAPDTDEAVIAAAREKNILMIPGAFTPTEIKRAFTLGGAMVKLFPASDPAYIKAVRAPLNHIPLMATGGVSADNAAEFLRAGASALGVGSNLTKSTLSPDEVTAQARQLVAAVQSTLSPQQA